MKYKNNLFNTSKIQEFVDREEARSQFWQEYRVYKKTIDNCDDVKVLSYYGIGGIGKSKLISKIIAEIQDYNQSDDFNYQIKTVYFDFMLNKNVFEVLRIIKSKLELNYNFKFPLFDLAFYAYAQKLGTDIPTKEFKTYIEKSAFLRFAFTATEAIPLVGTVSQLLKAADNGISFVKQFTNNYKQDLSLIENLSITELAKKLPYFFALDLSDNLKDSKEPLVVFLDTFEECDKKEYAPYANDSKFGDLEWLIGYDGIMQNVPKVIWVLCGRNKLSWDRYDPEWNNSITEIQLDVFSEDYSRQFLSVVGLSDIDFCRAIHKLTGGIPVYLGLCADKYRNMLANGQTPNINDFGNNEASLTDSFLKNVKEQEKDIIYLLACMQVWSDDLLEKIGNKLFKCFDISLHERIKEYSFIKITDTSSSMHTTVSDLICNACQISYKTQIIKTIIEVCETEIEDKSIFSENYTLILELLINSKLKQNPSPDDLESFYIKNYIGKTTKLLNYNFKNEVLKIFMPFYEYAKKYTDSKLFALATWEYARMLESFGKYQESLTYAQKAYSLYVTICGRNSQEAINASGFLSAILLVLGRIDEADDLLTENIKLEYKDEPNFDFDEQFSFENNSPFNFQKIDLLDKLEDYIQKTQKITSNEEFIKEIKFLTSCLSKATLLKAKGQIPKAYQMAVLGYEKSQKLLGQGHLITITSLSLIAEIEFILGHFKKALDIYNDIYDSLFLLYGDQEHIDMINAQMNIATILSKLDRDEEAIDLYKQIHAKLVKLKGEDHPDVILNLHNMSCALNAIGRHSEAFEIESKAYNRHRELYGENHICTIQAELGLGCSLLSQKKFSEAAVYVYDACLKKVEVLKQELTLLNLKELYLIAQALIASEKSESSIVKSAEKASAIFELILRAPKQSLQNAKIDINDVRKKYGITLVLIQKFEKALPLMEEAYQIDKQTLGLSHEVTFITLQSLIVIYTALRMYEKKLKVLEDLNSIYEQKYDELHPEMLNLLNEIVECFELLGRYQSAIIVANSLYSKEVQKYGESSKQALVRLFQIGCLHYACESYQSALAIFDALYKKEVLLFGSNENPHVLKVLRATGLTLKEMGCKEEAVSIITAVSKIRNKILESDHPDIEESAADVYSFLFNTRFEKIEVDWSILDESFPEPQMHYQNSKESSETKTENNLVSIIILDDDNTSLLFVKHMLLDVFNIKYAQLYHVLDIAQKYGRCNLGKYPRAEAEQMIREVKSMAKLKGYPFECFIEE